MLFDTSGLLCLHPNEVPRLRGSPETVLAKSDLVDSWRMLSQ